MAFGGSLMATTFGRTIVSVWSGEFRAALPFYFEPHPLTQFVREMETLHRTLKGSATLRPMWDSSAYLSFTVDQLGHVTVTGFFDYGSQEVRFKHVTDQTCLGPLLADVRSCVDAPAT